MLFRSDKSVTYQKLLFEPSGAVPMDMLATLNNVSQSDEAKGYVTLRVYQDTEEETPVAQPTLSTPTPTQAHIRYLQHNQ